MADKEIVDLVITAENLATKELEKAASDVKGLGDEVDKTETQLDQLKIDQDTIQSYSRLEQEVEQLDDALAASVVSLKKSQKELKANKEATNADAKAVEKQAQSVKRQRSELTKRNNELVKTKAALKTIGVTTSEAAATESIYAARILETQTRLTRLNAVQDKRIASLRTSVAAEQASVVAQKKSAVELKKQAAAQEKSAAAAAKLKAAQKASNKQALLYAVAIERLNKAFAKGVISKDKYIAKERILRSEFKQTAAQAKAAGFAIDKSTAGMGSATKNTDALTKVTRRLAQAYTVLIATQSAGRVIADNVKEFGALEEAQTKVLKTTDLMRSEIISMTDEMLRLAEDVTPTATNELLRYAEVAGQLGVEGTENILRMVSAADALNVSTDLAGDEAVTLLTRILTMTREGVPAIDGLASAVVELGNNTATTESEIVQMTKEIVTGTQSINLGSTAAAGFGATLKEIGQRGESSRSAFTRLSNTIKLAVLEGGDELIKLSDITGQTAEELERNLGERPEQVLFDFVKGLKGVKDEGGSVKNTLDQFGLTSLDTLSVIEALATNTDRLARNLKLADDAQVAGNAHLKEAAKQYGTQNSALDRLNNKFIDIKASIGEAFSDETNQTVERLGEILEENKDSIIEFFEGVSELGSELVELGGSVLSVGKAFSTLADGGEDVSASMYLITTSINILENALNGVAFLMLQVKKGYLEISKAISGSSEEIVNALADIERQQQQLAAATVKNNKDAADALLDANGQSSDSYRDVLAAAEKYKDEVKNLDTTQRAQLDTILTAGAYNKDLDDTSRELVASLVKLGRETDVLTAAEKLRLEGLEKAQVAQTQQNHLDLAMIESQKGVGRQLLEVAEDLEHLRNIYRLGAISESEFFAKSKELIDSQQQLQLAYVETSVELVKHSKVIKDTSVSYEGLSDSSFKLTKAFDKAIAVEKKAEAALLSLAKGTDAYAAAERKLAIAKSETVKAGEASVSQLELESKTVTQLNQLKKDLIKQIDKETKAKNLSTGSVVEYNKKIDELKKKLASVNKLIGDNTDKTTKNTKATRDNTDARKDSRVTLEELIDSEKDLTAAKEENTWVTEENAKATFTLNSANDLAAKSTDDLIARYELLSRTVAGVTVDIGNLSETGRQIDGVLRRQKEFELTFINQTLAARKLQEQLSSNNLSLRELDLAAARVKSGFSELGEDQLAPLRNAIESARREFERLDATISNSLSRTQDRLDRLLGNEEQILERQFERELKDARDQLELARESGNRGAVADAQENIKLLERIRRMERENFKERQRERVEQEKSRASDEKLIDAGEVSRGADNGRPATTTQTAQRTVNINIKTSDGSTATVNVVDDGSAESLVDILANLGDNNVNGAQ